MPVDIKYSNAVLWVALGLSIFLLIPFSVMAQETRSFPELTAPITDLTGSLSQEEIGRLQNALDHVNELNGMDGHVVIVSSTPEWHLKEYLKDYADYLQGREKITSSGWLLYVSLTDRKFGLAVQDEALTTITPERQAEIELAIGAKFEQDSLVDGLIDGINTIAKHSSKPGAKQKSGFSPDMMFLTGIIIVVVVLMRKLRKSQSDAITKMN